jgi:hypothetical protein
VRDIAVRRGYPAQSGQTEVADDASFSAKEDVARLDVPVHKPATVKMLQTPAQLDADIDHARDGSGLPGMATFPGAVRQILHDERRAIGGDLGMEDSYEVRVIARSHRLRLGRPGV